MLASQKTNKLMSCPCHHTPGNKGGLVLVAIGNTLRGDDGIAQVICDALPKPILQNVCCFALGSYTGLLIECLAPHNWGIILDATSSGSEPGAVTIIDLAQVLRTPCSIKLDLCHGFSLVEELQLARWRGLVPETLIFFGVEVANTDWGEGLSKTLQVKVSYVASELEHLIEVYTGKQPLHA